MTTWQPTKANATCQQKWLVPFENFAVQKSQWFYHHISSQLSWQFCGNPQPPTSYHIVACIIL